MVRDPECYVYDCWVEDWYIDFRRPLSVPEFERWKALQDELANVVLDSDYLGFRKRKSFSLPNLYIGSSLIGEFLAGSLVTFGKVGSL
jgi:hypothetical protein